VGVGMVLGRRGWFVKEGEFGGVYIDIKSGLFLDVFTDESLINCQDTIILIQILLPLNESVLYNQEAWS